MMKNFQKKMGERIKMARKISGLSREVIAKAVGTSKTSILRWEQGGSIPAASIPIIAKLTNHPLEFFLSEDHQLSETKIQSTAKALTKLGELIDEKDTEIDKLKLENTKLKEQIEQLKVTFTQRKKGLNKKT